MSKRVEEGAKLRNLGRKTRDWTPVLRAAGSLLVGAAQRAFVEQKRGSVKWPPRAVPNRAGIVADLAAGRSVPARRFQPRPAAVDTGRLKGSITYRVVGRAEVRVGTNVPYASKVQEGGRSVVTLPKTARPALGRLIKRNPELEKGLGFLLSKGRLEIDVPARPFVTVEREDVQKIQKLASAHARGG